jgi:hypothetical protein
MIVIAAVLATSAWLVSAALSREPLAAFASANRWSPSSRPTCDPGGARAATAGAEAYLQSRAHDAYRIRNSASNWPIAPSAWARWRAWS